MKKQNIDYQLYFDALKKSPNFKELSDEVLHTMLCDFTLETWKKGTYFLDGEKTRYKTYIVLSGRIKMFQIHPEKGTEHTLYVNTTGDLFDIVCLLDGKKHSINMEALDDVFLLSTPIQNVKKWMTDYPKFNTTFLAYIAKQLRSMEEKANDLALFSTWVRTLKLFVKNAVNKHQHHENPLINNLNQTEIANIIGTSKNVVNRHILKLKKKNIIKGSKKHLEINNFEELYNELKKHS